MQRDEGKDVIEVESIPSVAHVERDGSRFCFEVAVGDDVVMDEKIGRVSDVRESDGMQGGEIDVELDTFEATIKDGFWKCRDCDRVSAEPRTDVNGAWKCSVCQREDRADRKRRNREEWEDRVEDALETDADDAKILI